MKYIYTLVLLLVFASCNVSTEKSKEEKGLLKFNDNLKKESIYALNLESFLLDSIESSYIGNICIVSDTLYFIDERFAWVFRFNKNGKLIDRNLGLGGGPQEIETGLITGYCILPEGWMFVGAADDCHIFDKAFFRGKRFVIDRGGSREISYKNAQNYTKWYGNIIMKYHNANVYYNVYVERPGMSSFDDKEEYYEKVGILLKMDINTGKITDVLGSYPPKYSENKGAILFDGFYYDMDNKGNFYVNYEADSLIYCYDANFIPTQVFGYNGKKMNRDYPFVSNEDYLKSRNIIKEKYAYFTHIKYIEEINILFRSYKRSIDEEFDGLQIYKEQILIGDVDVPKGFKVLGYISPYVYATTGIDEENETIELYKFKL